MSDMKTVIVDDMPVEVPGNYSLMQVCESVGIEVPRFCYHERLSVAGNCRMCLVEVKGAPKLQASCALRVDDLRPGPEGQPPVILTKSEAVQRGRAGVMEFLLINHPLDCPVCDQGGECDLQDQAMAYGGDSSRYALNKRGVENKDFGALIKTSMNRCIHCTRCVRFSTEVAGVQDLGASGRGEDMEITTYLDHIVDSEVSGNVIDLCPVGALTAKPLAFHGRPWELKSIPSIDVMDAMGSAIRLDIRGSQVMRILPRQNEDINQEWITDKARFVVDGLRNQRLDRPYIRIDGALQPASWTQALALIYEKLRHTSANRMAALVGDLCDMESVFLLRKLMQSLGVDRLDSRQDGAFYPTSLQHRALWRFNTKLEDIIHSDLVLIIGSNPRHEAPLLNVRLRQAWLANGMSVGMIGQPVDLTYPYQHLGDNSRDLLTLLESDSPFAAQLRTAKKPMIIVGAGALQGPEGAAVMGMLSRFVEHIPSLWQDDWQGINILQHAAGRLGAMELGFLPVNESDNINTILDDAAGGKIDVIYALGVDEIDWHRKGDAFLIYQGSHGDVGAMAADVILPSACYIEKNALYMNMQGQMQEALAAVPPVGDAKPDWQILASLYADISGVAQMDSEHDGLSHLREIMFAENPHLPSIGEISPVDWQGFSVSQTVSGQALGCVFKDYFLTNPIARCSKTMADCSHLQKRPEHPVSRAA